MNQATPSVFNPQLDECRQKLVTNVQTMLFHAIRFVVHPEEEHENDFRQEWDEFLSNETPFAFDRMPTDRDGPVFHSCFYGSKRALKDFNGLAAKIAYNFPLPWPEGLKPSPKTRGAIRDRNLWMLAIYELISQKTALGEKIPIQGNPGGQLDFDPVGLVGLHNQRVQEDFAKWCKANGGISKVPKYVFVTPEVNVFKYSFDVIQYAHDHPKEFGIDWPDTV